MRLPDAVSLLDRDRAAFLAAYDALTPAQRSFRPPGGGWTAGEVAQHLVKVETSTLHIVQKQAAAGDARREVGAPDEARLASLEAYLRSDARFPMPEVAAKAIAPTDEPDADWRARLEAIQSEWHALAEALPDDLADAGLMEHFRAGGLTAGGTARFLAAHIEHHTRQLERLRVADGFPA